MVHGAGRRRPGRCCDAVLPGLLCRGSPTRRWLPLRWCALWAAVGSPGAETSWSAARLSHGTVLAPPGQRAPRPVPWASPDHDVRLIVQRGTEVLAAARQSCAQRVVTECAGRVDGRTLPSRSGARTVLRVVHRGRMNLGGVGRRTPPNRYRPGDTGSGGYFELVSGAGSRRLLIVDAAAGAVGTVLVVRDGLAVCGAHIDCHRASSLTLDGHRDRPSGFLARQVQRQSAGALPSRHPNRVAVALQGLSRIAPHRGGDGRMRR